MAATTVPSRFAVLSLDVEDDTGKIRKSEKKKLNSSDKENAKDKSKSGQQNKQQSQDAKKKANKKKENGNSKKQPAQQKQNKQNTQNSNNKEEEEQSYVWLERDGQYFSGSFENDLQQAFIISTLTNEEETKWRREQGLDEKACKKKGKALKPQAMSLDQFNKMQEGDSTKEVEEVAEPEENFFMKMSESAAEAFKREKKTELLKPREPKTVANVHVTLAQLQNDLANREEEIGALKKKVATLQSELTDVRARNTQLCGMLAQGEMKNKAEVLQEVEQLKSERNELWSELERLKVTLEQERSRSKNALSQPSEKGKAKQGKK